MDEPEGWGRKRVSAALPRVAMAGPRALIVLLVLAAGAAGNLELRVEPLSTHACTWDLPEQHRACLLQDVLVWRSKVLYVTQSEWQAARAPMPPPASRRHHHRHPRSASQPWAPTPLERSLQMRAHKCPASGQRTGNLARRTWTGCTPRSSPRPRCRPSCGPQSCKFRMRLTFGASCP